MPPVVLVLKCFLQFGYSVLFCAEECACSWKRSSRHQGENGEIANMHLQIRSWLPWSNPNITDKRKKRPLKVTTGNFKLGYVCFLCVEFEKVLIQFYLYNAQITAAVASRRFILWGRLYNNTTEKTPTVI